MILWIYVGLLAVHWVGDFYLQSHWMSVNKSTDSMALSMHVATYTAVLAIGAALLLGSCGCMAWSAIMVFVLLNGILHFATDYVTSRMTSQLWHEAFRPDRDGETVPFYPPRSAPIHDFFVVVGVDQYVHQLCLAATLWWLL